MSYDVEQENIRLDSTTEDIFIDIENKDELEEEIGHSPEGVTSYSTSISIDSLIPRLRKGHYYIPPFQRSYVWTTIQASKLIESILLGLPIPSIFLGQDADSKKYFVIDGQQRLKSLQKYYDDEFKLKAISNRWNGKRYSELPEDEQFQLGDFSVHAIIVKESENSGGDSIYQIFERINTGGVKLQAQEIRASSYHGDFNDLLNELSDDEVWSGFIQLNKSRQKPQELILRFFALNYSYGNYKPTMKTFMNMFMKKNRNISVSQQAVFRNVFSSTIKILANAFDKSDFILPSANVMNTQLLDSVMVGVAQNINNDELIKKDRLIDRLEKLKSDEEYITFCNSRRSSKDLVLGRIDKTIEAFKG